MAERVGKQWRAGMDTRTTTRWSDAERAWLESRAAATGKGVGTIARELVQVAMAVSREPVGSVVVAPAAGAVAIASAAAGAAGESTGAAPRVPRGAAASSPSAAAPPPRDLMADLERSLEPARRRVRLEVVVARMLDSRAGRPSLGPVPPARLADARRLIRAGRVRVSGVPASGVAADMLVGAGEVELVEARS